MSEISSYFDHVVVLGNLRVTNAMILRGGDSA